MPNPLDALLDDAEAYAKASGLKITTVSNKLFGHGNRIDDYRSKRISPSLKTIECAITKLEQLQKEAA